jgi:5-methylcytosine-specific restriction protein A
LTDKSTVGMFFGIIAKCARRPKGLAGASRSGCRRNMGKLKALKPRVRPAGARLAGAVSGAPGAAAEPHWRRWYKTQRWRELRRRAIERDGGRCRQTGVALVGRYPAGNSAAVDHIVKHNGDPALFWDLDNLQTVSKAWHDREKQRLEKRGWSF